jgi:uncharacterized membrane protein
MIEARKTASGAGVSALIHILVRLMLFVVVTMMVWVLYVYLYAFSPDFLGWCFASLRPVTIWLFSFVDGSLPVDLKYKVSAGLTDELGPRALFLLILAGLSEIILSTLYWMVLAAMRAVRNR